MKKALISLAVASVFASQAFAAEPTPTHSVTANVGVVTDYVFRGISQSQHQPAVQGGVDYAHASGLYAGVWGSTIEWVNRKDWSYQKDNNLELDLYGGYKGAVGDFTYDVGAIRYFYPGKFQTTYAGSANVTANTTEVYVAGGWKFVTLKYSEAVSQNFIGWGGTAGKDKTKGSGYTDLTVTYPVNETLNVIAHYGHQSVKNTPAGSKWSYNDWKIGVTKDLGFGVVGLAYTDTDAKFSKSAPGANYNWAGKDVGKGVLAASFVKNF